MRPLWPSDATFGEACRGYDSRAVLTEFGVPMTSGVNHDGARDGTNDVSYLYAMTDTVCKQGVGSIIWVGVKNASQTMGPGPWPGTSTAITSLGSGPAGSPPT